MIKVAQCWDDGPATDIRLTDLLRKYHAKATFNLCSGWIKEKTVPAHWGDTTGLNWYIKYTSGIVGMNDLKRVYDGFQLASHCRFHESAGIAPDRDFLKAALDSRHFLEDTFQKECRGFAYPGGRHTPETELLLADAGFLYGRTTENTDNVIGCKTPLALASSCHFLNPRFWQIFTEAKKTGIFYFWGHSYELMDSPQLWARFELAIKILSESPDVEWIDVIDIVPLIHAAKSGSAK